VSYANYEQYLRHPTFLKSVEVARIRSGHQCEKCSAKTTTEPHHLKYCQWGEFDPPENILMLCRSCHIDEHTCDICGKVTLSAFHIKNNLTSCCHALLH